MNLYSYGPMVAGALPEWNKVTHPFGFMAENAVMEGAFALYISDGPFIYDTANGVIVPTEGAEVLRATWYTDKWSDFVLSESAELLVAQWCNVDIETDAGGVFLAAEPIVLYDAPLIITHDVTVDMMIPSMPSIVHAVQDDQYSRDIRFIILSGGKPWPVPANAAVCIDYEMQGGNTGHYSTMPDGSAAVTISGNLVTAKVAPQVVSVAGKIKLSVSISCAGTEISTFWVWIFVKEKPGIVPWNGNYYKVAGCLPDSGWNGDKYLCTDENGNVVEKNAPEGGSSGGTVTSIDFTNFANGSFTEVVDGEEVSHSVTFDESGRPATVDGVTMEWPEEKEESSGFTLPVVEIADTTAITAEESALLTSCIGMPCIVKIAENGGAGAAVCPYLYMDGTHMFQSGSAFFLSSDGATWVYEG